MRLYTSVFFLLGILFVPFSFQFYTIQTSLTELLFGKLINWTANQFGLTWELSDFSSDSVRGVLLYAWLLIFSIPISLLFKKKGLDFSEKFIQIVTILITYYLSWVLLKYGLDKLFKAQFYSPEPNILFSKVGDLDKDMLFWTSMGSSYTYSVITGIFEILPAILLLFKKTRNLGVLIAIGVFIHVFALNIGFDISVKFFVCFLLLMSCFLAYPFAYNLWLFLSNQPVKKIPTSKPIVGNLKTKNWLKAILIVGICLESLYPFIKTGNFNDDLSPRPIYHGAYQVESVIKGIDTLSQQSVNLKRIFIHRDNYLIFQDTNDQFEDFYFELNGSNTRMKVMDYNQQVKNYSISFNQKTQILTLKNEQQQIICKALSWKKMALLQPLFHWTVD
jgi:hypothetical protein